MANGLDIPFDRITYRDGQLLTARDLRDDTRRDARLRRLHVQHVHETWGIALGLEVHAASDGKTLAIGPGYAVDGMGHDILLPEGISLGVPDVVGPQAFVLVLGYLEDTVFQDRHDLATLCVGEGLDPRHERPSFSWLRPEDVRFGPQVPLIQVIVANGVVHGGLDLRVRRNARALVRPHFGSGTTESGRTGWQEWAAGIEVLVDTAEAGFTRTPYYFPVLHADFGPSGKALSSFPDSLGFVAQATPTRFTYRFIKAEALLPGLSVSSASAEEHGWTISWLGVEPVTGCAPALLRIFSLSGFKLAGLLFSKDEA